MKPSQVQNKKLNLSKQTIQKLDSKKMANVYAAGQNILPTILGLTISITTGESYVCEPPMEL